MQEFRLAARALARHRTYTVVAVLALAIGIGANTAIFSIVNAVIFRPLRFPEPEQLAVVLEKDRRIGELNAVSPANYTDIRDNTTKFASLAAAEAWSATLM